MHSITEKNTPLPSGVAEDSEKGQVVDSHADLGLKYLTEHGVVQYTEEEASKVRWKIDMYLMPIVSLYQVSFHLLAKTNNFQDDAYLRSSISR